MKTSPQPLPFVGGAKDTKQLKGFMKKNNYSAPIVHCTTIAAISVLCASVQGVTPQIMFTEEDGTGFSAD